MAAAVRAHPDASTGIGSVDPHKESAVDEVAEIAALGLRGVKFHPSLQAFAPDDEHFWPVFAACESHGLLALFHTGTSGIGARQPGGQGIRIDYAHPLKLDSVAAAFPRLTVVAAHFGWPWHMDLLAMALHKTNVYVDISGWSPRRIPAEVTREMKGRLADQFLWGSDFPFIEPERCLLELGELGLDSPALLRETRPASSACPRYPSYSNLPAETQARRPWKVRRRSLTQASGFSQGMKWPPWSWALTFTWLNHSACGQALNARTRSSAVWMPGGFSYVTKVRPTGACTTGVRSWAGAQG